jgi:uncharacterized protein (TIGR02001 family)
MKFFKSILVAVTMMVSANVMAWDFSNVNITEKNGITGDIGLYSDYVFRGVSQTQGGVAANANLRYDVNAFYITAFTSNVNIPDANLEATFSAGFNPNITSNWDVDLGAITYLYPDQIEDININTWEIYGGTSYDILDTNVGLKIHYSDDYYDAGKSWYSVVPVTYDNRYFQLMGSIGYLNLNEAEILKHQTDYKVSFAGHITPRFDVVVAWTNLSPATDNFKLDFDIGDDIWMGGLVYKF